MTTIAALLSPRDRQRLAARVAELTEIERLAKERGQQKPPPEPLPLHRQQSERPAEAGRHTHNER